MIMQNKSEKNALLNRIFVTVLCLVCYRIGSFLPIPYIDVSRLFEISDYTSKGIFGMFNMLSGGSLERMSIFAIGVVPYITASIVIQLIFAGIPALKKVKEEGESGQIKIHQYTKYLAVIIAMIQGFSIAGGLASKGIIFDTYFSTFFSKIVIALTLSTGTLFLIWLGKTITSKGIGNGISMIIFTGIISQFPTAFVSVFQLFRSSAITAFDFLLFIASFVGATFVIIIFEKSYKIIKIQHPKSMSHMFSKRGGVPENSGFSELPLKVNPSGVIPSIFASSLLLLPATFFSFAGANANSITIFMQANFTHGKPLFIACYVMLIIFFSYFYSEIVSNPKEISDRFMKANYLIAGIRPGVQTYSFLKSIISRLCLIGGLYLSFVCILPEVISNFVQQTYLVGGTSLLIVIGVINDLVEQIYSHMLSSKYSKIFNKQKKLKV